MTKEEIGSVLKRLRIDSGKTQKEVAELIGRKQQIVGHWETGYSQPDANTLFTLCDIYGTTVDAAFGFNKKIISAKDLKFLNSYHNLDDYGKETIDIALERETKRVTHLKKQEERIKELEHHQNTVIGFENYPDAIARYIQYYQKVSAGTGEVIYEDTLPERIAIPDIPKYRRVAYAVNVSGNSMEPLYKDGDMLLIEPTCIVDVGEIGIFNIDGKGYVKKRGETELISLNKGYKNIPLSNESKCMGRVVDKYVTG